MKVFKFGGASVNSIERIKNVGTILQQYREQKILVVISAIGKTTNALEKVVEAFYNNKKEEDFILIGLSLGGMIAAEIAHLKSPRKVILLSSISVSDEMPWYFRFAGKIGVQKAIPVSVYKNITILNAFMGGANKADRAMLLSFVKQTDPLFIRWAVDAILGWNQQEPLNDIVHIHGNKDRLLPIRYTHANHVIKDGRHLMVLNKAGEINKVLQEVLPAY